MKPDSKSFDGVSAVPPNTDHPTRTLNLTLTPWGDQCLDAVACKGSGLIRPAWVLCLGILQVDSVGSGCCGLTGNTLG